MELFNLENGLLVRINIVTIINRSSVPHFIASMAGTYTHTHSATKILFVDSIRMDAR